MSIPLSDHEAGIFWEGNPIYMRFKSLTLAAAVAGTLALTASPASAAPQAWQAVSTNSSWDCGTYKHHKVSDNVNYKVCIVMNSGGYAQAVLVVQNKASVAVRITGEVTTNIPGGADDCAVFTLKPGYTRGCFGPTKYVGSGVILWADARLNLNNVNEWYMVTP
ncbi:hypothetical protein [Streptomyces sp. NPDC001820]|uniref:hypothetical protein n=1 Tax=Streptomyces sp. NPDC001820 TaxID=3364613 RepID=UPI0036B1F0E4